MTNLQLTLSAAETDFDGLGLRDLVETAIIDTLEVLYVNHNWYAQDERHVLALKLPNLKRIALTDLCAKPSTFAALLRIHSNRLTSVSLKDCSTSEVPAGPPPTFAQFMGQIPQRDPRSGATQWLSILNQFRDCDNLVSLHLERLQIKSELTQPDRFGNTELPIGEVDETMSLCGEWRSKEEIDRALQALEHQADRLLFSRRPRLSQLPRQCFLNLRFANFKASPSIYSWTARETFVLSEYRFYREHHLHNDSLADTPFDNAHDFPTRKVDDSEFSPLRETTSFCYAHEARLPSGRLRLPHLLWGKWETVWIRKTTIPFEVIREMAEDAIRNRT